MRRIILLLLFPVVLVGQNQWTSQFDAVRSYSSPRATDLNQDGILDIVLGSGVDGFASPFGAIAVNGANGNTLGLWNRLMKFSAALFFTISTTTTLTMLSWQEETPNYD